MQGRLALAGRTGQISDLDAGQSLRPVDDARAVAAGAPGAGPGGGPLLPARAVPQRPAPGGIALCPLRKAHRPVPRRGQAGAEAAEEPGRYLSIPLHQYPHVFPDRVAARLAIGALSIIETVMVRGCTATAEMHLLMDNRNPSLPQPPVPVWPRRGHGGEMVRLPCGSLPMGTSP